MLASVVIRARNEAQNLRHVLAILQMQKQQDFEVIIVDNDSEDETAHVGREFGAKVLHVAKNEFSLPKSLNIGTTAATGEFLVIMSAHSFPLTATWLSCGLRHFENKEIGGVYSPVLARADSGIAEKLFYLPGYLSAKLRGIRVIDTAGWGVLGFTNAIIRRSLWERHPFDERHGLGGEDNEWARWLVTEGHKIVCDPSFVVRHSHGLTVRQLIEQCQYWKSVSATPQPFDRQRMSFRSDS